MKDDREAAWEADIAAGVAAFHRGDHGEAEQHFQQAFELAQEWQPGSLYSLWSFDYLMLVYRLQGKEAEAEALRQQAVTISKQLGEQAEALRQTATTPYEVETALGLQGNSVFFGRRGKWIGRGAAESFASSYPGLELNIHSRFLEIGDHEAMARGDYSSRAVRGHAIVQSSPGWVLLRLDGKYGDETQVSLSREECEQLIQALQEAVSYAWSTDP
jgi:hypothetical protein